MNLFDDIFSGSISKRLIKNFFLHPLTQGLLSLWVEHENFEQFMAEFKLPDKKSPDKEKSKKDLIEFDCLDFLVSLQETQEK